jgi:hypothetical protein
MYSWFPEGHEQYDRAWIFTSIDYSSPKPYRIENPEDEYSWTDSIKPILRRLSSMTDDEILHCGKLLCAIPNNSADFTFEIQHHHNTIGASYSSDRYTSGQYFSIYNEKNKVDTVGHIEIGWYSDKIDKRKTRELWKVGGCHKLTHYLLKQRFDLFSLIDSGQAIDAKTIQPPQTQQG